MRILYDSKNLKFKSPFGPLKQNESCSIAVLIPQHCKTTSVYLVFKNHEFIEQKRFLMTKQGEKDLYEKYTCEFSLNQTGLYFYCFYIDLYDVS